MFGQILKHTLCFLLVSCSLCLFLLGTFMPAFARQEFLDNLLQNLLIGVFTSSLFNSSNQFTRQGIDANTHESLLVDVFALFHLLLSKDFYFLNLICLVGASTW